MNLPRIFVYEYLCARRADGDTPSARALRPEGLAMRDAVADDLRRAGAEVVTLSPDDYVRDEKIAFQRKAATALWTLVVAPESDGLLEERCRWVVEAGGRLLGPSPAAVSRASDKLELSHYLRAAGVPTPRCRSLAGGRDSDGRPLGFPQVWKPRHGAGCVATVGVRSPEEAAAALESLRAEGKGPEDMVAQEWVPGRPASVAFLLGPADTVALLPAWQDITAEDWWSYLGGELPIPEPFASRAVALARRAVRSVPGLVGYAGVDLVLGERPGEADWVIEINPRLTTSYVGLRALAEFNLAGAMLDAALGRPLPPLRWRPGKVRFGTEGDVTEG